MSRNSHFQPGSQYLMGQGLYFKGLLSEKMEKYINHDLDLIQEEQEQNAIQMNKNKF